MRRRHPGAPAASSAPCGPSLSMVDICRDMEEMCPGGLAPQLRQPHGHELLGGERRQAPSGIVGLCHSVQGTAHWLSALGGGARGGTQGRVPLGSGHQPPVVVPGASAGRARTSIPCCAQVDDQAVYNLDTTRFEMLKHLGALSPPSPAATTPSTSPGSGSALSLCKSTRRAVVGTVGPVSSSSSTGAIGKTREGTGAHGLWRGAPGPEVQRGVRFYLSTRWRRGCPAASTATYPNTGLITNLPEGCCVEVPCYVDKHGINPCFVGDCPRTWPPSIAAILPFKSWPCGRPGTRIAPWSSMPSPSTLSPQRCCRWSRLADGG